MKQLYQTMQKWFAALEEAIIKYPNAETSAWQDAKCLQSGCQIGDLILAYKLSSFRQHYGLSHCLFPTSIQKEEHDKKVAQIMARYRADVQQILDKGRSDA